MAEIGGRLIIWHSKDLPKFRGVNEFAIRLCHKGY